ncbi:MBL fold metallo-hydrolase [Bradyrhizobium neotropicale]|uniref:MBL fold metallo-hydrolase n=1 Tax=Bradyrhizobium neotropicale TaxID=1497615 RepID=UPI001AD6C35D|nr:MBL fold metallo-hydrolase [Bradyrhizobium neotropicale]MBO4228132.1 MBL fold metallo-hydrolase [Bradyrhizobium neotropicale]
MPPGRESGWPAEGSKRTGCQCAKTLAIPSARTEERRKRNTICKTPSTIFELARRTLGNAIACPDPKSITKIVFTHAHPDHIWGTIGAGGTLNFPNAAYYVSAVEWDFWMDPHLTTKLPEQMHVFVTGAQTNLGAVKDRVTMVKPGDDIVTGLSVLDSSGHTPGHISLLLAGSEGLLIPADAITEPAVYFPHPEWQFAYDMDNGAAVANRKKLLDRAATDRMKMLGFHWPYPGLGFAERKGTGYQYVAAA